MLRKLVYILGALALATTANAAESKSEFFYQPKGGGKSIEAGIKTVSFTFDTKTTAGAKYGTISSGGSPAMVFKYAHALDEDMAVGAVLSNSALEVTNKPDAGTAEVSTYSGLSDILAKFVAKSDMGSWILRYGADFNLPINKRKEPDGGTKKAGTATTVEGGMVLTPYVGGTYALNSELNLGARFLYRMPFERATTIQGATDTDAKIKGGDTTTITFLAEYNYGSGLVGANFGMKNYGAEKQTVSGTESDFSKAYSATLIGLNASYDINPEWTGYFAYDMEMISGKLIDSALDKASYTQSYITLNARYSF